MLRLCMRPNLSYVFQATRSCSTESRVTWYEELHRSTKPGSRARVGRLHTPHGSFFTPAFVPVYEEAPVLSNESDAGTEDDLEASIRKSKVSMTFCNTYHLMLHPGADVVERAGGLHRFMGHRHPLITDSGGFQVFSLAYSSLVEERRSGSDEEARLQDGGAPGQESGRQRERDETREAVSDSGGAVCDAEGENRLRESKQGKDEKQWKRHMEIKRQKAPQYRQNSVTKITEEGVTFRSYRDGTKVVLTPETSVAAQKQLGADVIIPFDELPAHNISDERLRESFERTHRWQQRSVEAHQADVRSQAMWAVVHGGIDKDLRRESVARLSQMPFDGFAIGGSLGKTRDDVIEVTDHTMRAIEDRSKPVHLLGIGDMPSMLACVPFGVDSFDSSFPTRAARHGNLYTSEGALSIRKGKFKEDLGPLDPACLCSTCVNHSRAYLHHLFKVHEPSFAHLASIHNLFFYHERMREVREDILNNRI